MSFWLEDIFNVNT